MSENFFASSFCRRLHDEMACIIVRHGYDAFVLLEDLALLFEE